MITKLAPSPLVSPVSAGSEDDRIRISRAVFDLPLSLPLVSTRLAHVLQAAGIQRFGELDGWTYSQLLELPNCGRKTIAELRSLLTNSDALTKAPPVERLSVPASLHALSLFDLPVSSRLTVVLRKNGISRLGELHGITLDSVRRFNRRGRETASELTRLLQAVARSEAILLARDFSPALVPELLRDLTTALGALPSLKHAIVKLRLGGGVDACRWSVSAIAAALGTSVNQLSITLHRSWESIRILAGPGPCMQLRRLSGFCLERVCPLAAPLLSFWLGGRAVPHADASTSLAFYVRLIRKLEPTVPAWPDGNALDTLTGIRH